MAFLLAIGVAGMSACGLCNAVHPSQDVPVLASRSLNDSAIEGFVYTLKPPGAPCKNPIYIVETMVELW